MSAIESFLTSVEKRLEAAKPELNKGTGYIQGEIELLKNAKSDLEKAVKALRVAIEAIQFINISSHQDARSGEFENIRSKCNLSMKEIESILGEK